MSVKVHVLASQVSDNFFYMVEHKGLAALVDPIDAALAIDAVRERELELVAILNTHWHPDHISGDVAVRAAFPEARVVAGAGDADQIEALIGDQGISVEERLRGGDTWRLGSATLDVIDAPGHTMGHVIFAAGDHLLSGDVLFRAGSGHCKFGGEPGALFRTYRDVLRRLDPARIPCPGHDYAVKNLDFALSIEPDRADLRDAREAAQAAAPRTLDLKPLSWERALNPFMRYDDSALRERLVAQHGELFEAQRALSEGGDEDEATWRTLRRLRDQW